MHLPSSNLEWVSWRSDLRRCTGLYLICRMVSGIASVNSNVFDTVAVQVSYVREGGQS